MEQINNRVKQENKNTVGGAALCDTYSVGTALNKCRGDFNRPHFEGITKSKNGITLITLTITILVMLIIATTIIIVTSDNGLIDDAHSTTEQLNNRIAKDEQITAGIIEEIKNELKGGTTTPVEGTITLNKSSLSLEIVDGVNSEETLTATKQNLSGTVSWTSSKPTVATVDANGKVTTVGAGTTIITASCDGKTATCEVTVTTKTTPKVTLSPTTGEIEVDATLVLTASLNVTPTQNIVWTSSDDTIATVVGSGENNITGTVTGVKAGGPVTITATYGDKTATCSVTVKEKARIISFFITGNTYYAVDGWDWETWCQYPEYNLDNKFYSDGQKIYTQNKSFWIIDSSVSPNRDVVPSDPIVEGHLYNQRSGGSVV